MAFRSGRQCRVQSFASRLKYSRYGLVTLVRALAKHLHGFGGVSPLAVFDRPRTIVTKSDPKTGAGLEWNWTFAEAPARLGPAVELCGPYWANQKRAVEKLVGWVKNILLFPRDFLEEQDLQTQLTDWHEDVNEGRPSRATGYVPGEIPWAEEAPRLRPEELYLRYPARRTDRHGALLAGYACSLTIPASSVR